MKKANCVALLVVLAVFAFPITARAQSITPDPCNTLMCLRGILATGAVGAATCTPVVAQFFAIKIPNNIPLQMALRNQYVNTCPGAGQAGPMVSMVINAFGPMMNPPGF